jgi:hypothetical protein
VIVFRWIVGVLGAFFAVCALLSFVLHVLSNSSVWLARARSVRHWLWLVLLLWFNVEVWGRVVLTIVHWKS